ncbi:MAG: hypothetical protein IKO30_02360 [Lachnospiraceae bacterium]|nr:hypothetical protein [Lachnospiraceae bacterium]
MKTSKQIAESALNAYRENEKRKAKRRNTVMVVISLIIAFGAGLMTGKTYMGNNVQVIVPSESKEVTSSEEVIPFPGGEIETGKKSNEIVSEEYSIKLYQRLMEYYNSEAEDTSKESSFVEYFGGAYIDETGRLIIKVVNGNEEEINVIRSLLGKKGYGISYCEYSYSELIKVVKLINDNGAKLRDSGVKLFNVSEDVADNKVAVRIAGYTDEDIKKVKEVADVPFLKFEDWYKR